MFGINVSGCFAIGVVAVVAEESGWAHPLLRPFLGTGVLGGFTTFSSYLVGVQRDLTAGAARTALLYATVTVVAALVAAWAGLSASRAILVGREAAQAEQETAP